MRDRTTVVATQQIKSGDPRVYFGPIFGALLPSIEPSYEITYADGHKTIRLGGEPIPGTALTIPTALAASAGFRAAGRALGAAPSKIVPSTLTETLTHRNGIHEVLSQQPISGASRNAHRAAANRALLQELDSDPAMARQLGEFLGSDDLVRHMQSGRAGLRNPPGTVWHHPIDGPDAVQLLRRQTHRAPELQPILHPGPHIRGGYGEFYGN